MRHRRWQAWKWPLFRQVLALFMLGVASRVGILLVTHQYRALARFELQRTAYSLATTGVFGNPYAIETGPTAHVSPGYPLILAGVYRIFGAGERGELVKEVLASAVSAAGWALLPLAGSVFGMPPMVGFLAGLLGAGLPLKLSVETKGDWEAPYCALATMSTACLTRLLWLRRTFSVREALGTGLAWGTSLLFVSALLPAFLLFACAGFFRSEQRSGYVKFLAIQFGLVALLLAPWVIRNVRELGSPIVTRSNFGLELRLSNNDLAGPLERTNYERGVYHVYHPLQSVKEAERVKVIGEPEFNRQSTREAFTWIKEHPARFLILTAERVFFFWFQPVPGQMGKAVFLGLMGILGFLGLWLLARIELWAAMPMALLFLMVPLPNYLVHVGLRHRFPLDWMCLLLGIYYLYHSFAPNRLASDAREVRSVQKR